MAFQTGELYYLILETIVHLPRFKYRYDILKAGKTDDATLTIAAVLPAKAANRYA